MKDCLFCKMIKGEVSSQTVFENENILAFKDIYPQAKEHYLFIHKKHSINILEMCEDISQVQDIFLGIKEFCSSSSLSQTGLRIVTNLGKDGAQSVFHTHFHLLGGEQLKGPFGA